MSRHLDQLTSELRFAVQTILDRGLNDPRISGMITVTGVRLSEDLKSATITVSVLPAEKQDLTLHGLRSAGPHIRRTVGTLIRSRQIPELTFKLDPTLKTQAGVLESIARATAEQRSPAKWGSPPAPEGGTPGGAAYPEPRSPEGQGS
jgi:ribosome-binding factor A